MFYSETLLSKTGPLARVWLSANLERKLSKTHILQSNIESSVSAIVDQGQAPMALRLSGQLLLGVVRIYSRKARYLLDDCNEALLKIKMAFRPGNVDLPAHQLNATNPASLTLPDVLTELDLLPPMPDASLLLTEPLRIEPDRDDGFDISDWGIKDSQLDPDPEVEVGRTAPEDNFELTNEDLGLDFGNGPLLPVEDETSMEVGRDAPAPRSVREDILSDDDKFNEIDLGFDLEEAGPANRSRATTTGLVEEDGMRFGNNDDVHMGDIIDFHLPLEEDAAPVAAPTPGRLQRDSQSPLSSIRSSVERDLEQIVRRNLDSTIVDPEEEEESVHQSHKAKKRRILQPDADTVLHSHQIKEQQNDRSRILKPASFLPRDPMILSLMNMQRNGGFVSSILGDGRGRGWAPELKGILSLEVVRKSGELKRKRDSGIADMGEEEDGANADKQPQLEIEYDDDTNLLNVPADPLAADPTLGSLDEIQEVPASDGIRPPMEEDEEAELAPQTRDASDDGITPAPDFDDTTAPVLDPADAGPVSLGTKHAVHLLRDRFGATDNPSQQNKANVLFQDLLPERTTSKADATKMFFEVLVLATKDAIKVEQADGALGGPIRVRGKRALWGSWAETDAGGEIAEQAAPSASAAVAVGA
ncbi:MAG: sister chromatid cohesion protein 1 [Candelina mexicana]|nr:MAG: sister chromatid cohesion protein 1 [Candelina mexicana]